MAKVQVRTAGGDYEVYVGHRLYEHELGDFLVERRFDKLAVVSHPSLIELHGERLSNSLASTRASWSNAVQFTFPEGEESKNLETLANGYRFLLEKEIGREDVILAFGGGVVGDLAGYLASSYLRGVRYMQAPTTLMAMVDSSIGGKVGVDLPGAKNAVGAFYQPQAVFCDLDVLRTLPQRELRSGMAEVAKYGLLYDPELLGQVEDWSAGIDSPQKDLSQIISRCAELKAAVVSEDERDLTGRRAILNYGHTFGHALESSTGYAVLRHGEAVALGMIMAARASELAGLAGTGLAETHIRILRPLLEGLSFDTLLDLDKSLAHMRADKKRGREIRFVLLEGLQKPRLVESLPEPVARKAMEDTLESLKGD